MADLLMKMPIPYEPKKQNRFILRFPTDLGINEWFVQTASRPKITITANTIKLTKVSNKSQKITWVFEKFFKFLFKLSAGSVQT